MATKKQRARAKRDRVRHSVNFAQQATRRRLEKKRRERAAKAAERTLIRDDVRWLVAITLPHQEARVMRRVEAAGAQVYAPAEVHDRQRRGKLVEVRRSVMPRSVFVGLPAGLSPDEAMRDVDGFHRWMTWQGDLVELAPASLQRFADVVAQYEEERLTLELKTGQLVRVTNGPFASFIGPVEEVEVSGRIRVAVDIFGRPTPIQLDAAEVEVAEPLAA